MMNPDGKLYLSSVPELRRESLLSLEDYDPLQDVSAHWQLWVDRNYAPSPAASVESAATSTSAAGELPDTMSTTQRKTAGPAQPGVVKAVVKGSWAVLKRSLRKRSNTNQA